MFLMSSKKTKVGPVLEALQSLSDEDLNTDDVCKRLEDLALEQKFTVTYLDLPEKSLSGNAACSVPWLVGNSYGGLTAPSCVLLTNQLKLLLYTVSQ